VVADSRPPSPQCVFLFSCGYCGSFVTLHWSRWICLCFVLFCFALLLLLAILGGTDLHLGHDGIDLGGGLGHSGHYIQYYFEGCIYRRGGFALGWYLRVRYTREEMGIVPELGRLSSQTSSLSSSSWSTAICLEMNEKGWRDRGAGGIYFDDCYAQSRILTREIEID
jgi:hypothetical protein